MCADVIDNVPEWIALLRGERAKGKTIAAIAREVGMKRPTLSLLLNDKYPASLARVTAKYEGAVLMRYRGQIACPHLGRGIGADECARHARAPMTLRSFDGRYEMQVQVSESLSFGVELTAAKKLIDECVERWSEGANDNVRALIGHALQVNKKGRIDTGRVLGLRKLEISDPEWDRAMTAIADAIRVTGSRTYARFYETDPQTGKRTSIPLDLAAV